MREVTLRDLSTRSYQYDGNGNLIADGLRTISYGASNKPVTVNHVNGNTANFFYGPSGERYKQVAGNAGATTTRYYAGNYEQEQTVSGATTTVVTRTTVNANVQYRTRSVNGSLASAGFDYLHRDHLGSVELVTNNVGAVEQRRGFDAFGKARDLNEDDSNNGLLGSDITKRGFTDHEHLDGVELIHMNGRVYDYNLGRFLSVDPFIAMPGNSQAYNPYSYVMNNPLRYTDPTGYRPDFQSHTTLNNKSERRISVKREKSQECYDDPLCRFIKDSERKLRARLKGNGESDGKKGEGSDVAGEGKVASSPSANPVPSEGSAEPTPQESGAATTSMASGTNADGMEEVTVTAMRGAVAQKGFAPPAGGIATLLATAAAKKAGLATAFASAAAAGVVLAVLPQQMGDATLTGNAGRQDGRIMHHYSPAAVLAGPLRADSYLTTFSGYSSDEAIMRLALNIPLGTQLFVHTFVVQPYQYRAAKNSISGTNFVAPAYGQLGWGIEYKSNVPLNSIGPSFPSAN